LWIGKPKARKKREDLYKWLANKMNLPRELTHFGYMDIEQLREAYIYIKQLIRKGYRYNAKGEIEEVANEKLSESI
jgi:hypothetical protein